MTELEKQIGYTFKKGEYLQNALRHSSYANENKGGRLDSNERLEFLGDSVLGFISAEFLYKNNAGLSEGNLTKRRSNLVCENSLFKAASAIDLGQYLLLSKGEEAGGGRARPSILADAMEALIGAIYLDGGEKPAKEFVCAFVLNREGADTEDAFIKDYKTLLQEIVQKNKQEVIEYELVKTEGPDHERRFTVEVRLNSNVVGTGVGKSKKDAEQQAARRALDLFGI